MIPARAFPMAVLLGLALVAAALPATSRAQGNEVPDLLERLGTVTEIAERGAASVVRVIRSEEEGTAARGRRFVGTGIAIGEGRILTCAGVVGAGRELLVAPADGDTLVARVAGVDRRTNLALLEAPGLSLPPLPVSAEALVLPGELVVAVGLGAPGTPAATFGTVVVSQGPSLGYSEVEMIQTTSPVFRGFTGGALLNIAGELIGVVSGVMELDRTGLFLPAGGDLLAGVLHQGSLMTITPSATTVVLPIHEALEIAEQLGENGYVERGYLGLQVELKRADSKRPASRRRGVHVHQVVEGGPAARAGLLPGDVILDFGGVAVGSPEELSYLVSSRLPGADVRVRFLRRGHADHLTVRIDQAPPLEWNPGLDASLAARETVGARPTAPLVR